MGAEVWKGGPPLTPLMPFVQVRTVASQWRQKSNATHYDAPMTTFRAWYDDALTDSYKAVTKLSDLHLSHHAWCERRNREPLDLPALRAALIKIGHRIGKYGVKGVEIR